MIHTPAKMGANLRVPHSPTIHTAINYLVTRPKKAFTPFAFITTEKDVPDVSFYQGNINFDTMESKTDTLIIRSGQRTWVDEKFERNYGESKRRGMLRGIYDFYDDTVSPRTHVDRIINTIGTDLPEMEIYIDWERTYGGQFRGLPNVVATMQSLEDRLSTVTAGLYTGYYWFRANSNPITNASQYNYLKTKPLWLAWYTNNPLDVLIPAPWTELTWWQYGTPEEDYGQESREIDKNYFNGTVQDFYARYSVVPSPPTGTGDAMRYKVVWAGGVARRSAPTTTNSVTSATPYAQNTIVEVIQDNISDATSPADPNKKWVKFSDGLYGASNYPDGTGPKVRMEKIVEPNPPATDYLMHFKSDGTVQKYVPE